MMDVNDWKREWAAARQSSSLAPGYGRADHWESFWNGYAERYALENRERSWLFRQIVDHLAAEGAVDSNSTVLDIGCGPGTFALPLASVAGRVTAIDPAEQMLAVLEKEAVFFDVADHIETEAVSWDTLPETRAYDLVFAANSPAIRDGDALMKMNRLSRHACCLISFAGAYHSRLRGDLWQAVMGKPLKSRAFDIQYPLNILYLDGYFPHLRFFPYQWTSKRPVEEAVRHYRDYFKLFGKETPTLEDEIRSLLTARAVEGDISEEQEGRIGVIWWRIKT